MNKLNTIALGQIISERGNIAANVENHLRFIRAACDLDANIVVFPELSLTGYEPDLAKDLAFVEGDARLHPLIEECAARDVIAVVGAPVRVRAGLSIAEFVLFPDRSALLYTKMYLHEGEERYFCTSDLNPTLKLDHDIISLAICADTSNPMHAERAGENKSTIYVASVLITPAGYDKDAATLRGYARRYNMTVMMVNHGGDSGGFRTAGKSALWNTCGDLIAEVNGAGENLLIARNVEGRWTGTALAMK